MLQKESWKKDMHWKRARSVSVCTHKNTSSLSRARFPWVSSENEGNSFSTEKAVLLRGCGKTAPEQQLEEAHKKMTAEAPAPLTWEISWPEGLAFAAKLTWDTHWTLASPTGEKLSVTVNRGWDVIEMSHCLNWSRLQEAKIYRIPACFSFQGWKFDCQEAEHGLVLLKKNKNVI